MSLPLSLSPPYPPPLPPLASLLPGMTHDGSHRVDVDPSRLEEALSIPDSTSFVSLRMAAPGGGGGGCVSSDDKRSTQPGEEVSAPAGLPAGALLRHCDGSVRFGGGCRGGSGAKLDATFKMMAPLAGCAGAGEGPAEASAAGCASAYLTARRRLLVQRPGEAAASSGLQQQEGEEVPWLVSFEAAAFPGQYLTVDQFNGTLALFPGHKARGSSSSSSSSSVSGKSVARAQTFRLHLAGAAAAAVGGCSPAAFTLEPLSRPGSRLQLASGGSQLHAEGGSNAESAALFELVPPAAGAYPRGSRVLHGGTRDFLLVPIGQVGVCGCDC